MANDFRKNKRDGHRGAKKEKPEYEQKLLDLARVTRVVKGGRRFSFRATLVIGNRKGRVGLGVAKGADASVAIGKAFALAKKNLLTIKRSNTSVAFEINKKFGPAKILIKPAKEGRGIVAGGAMRSVIELAGIKDVVGKSFGSSNKINVAKVTLMALKDLSLKLARGEEKTNKKQQDSEETSEEKSQNQEEQK